MLKNDLILVAPCTDVDNDQFMGTALVGLNKIKSSHWLKHDSPWKAHTTREAICFKTKAEICPSLSQTSNSYVLLESFNF